MALIPIDDTRRFSTPVTRVTESGVRLTHYVWFRAVDSDTGSVHRCSQGWLDPPTEGSDTPIDDDAAWLTACKNEEHFVWPKE